MDFHSLALSTLKIIYSMSVLQHRATATLESERAAFESEKKAHNELYEKQQQVGAGLI